MATGGASYPGTGSTGDGYRFAQKAGHAIIPLRPSLIPLDLHHALPLFPGNLMQFLFPGNSTASDKHRYQLSRHQGMQGIKVGAVDFGGEYLASINKIVEHAIVAGKREGIIPL